jgi:hypothetical protein
VRFQVLTAVSVALMMEAVRTSETSVYIDLRTRSTSQKTLNFIFIPVGTLRFLLSLSLWLQRVKCNIFCPLRLLSEVLYLAMR